MKQICRILSAVLAAAALCGCAEQKAPAGIPAAQAATQPSAETAPAPQTVPTEAAPPETTVPETMAAVVPEADAAGLLQSSCETAVIDYSHTEEGYVMACYTAETEKRLKLRLQGPGTTYTYDLVPGQWSVLPLSDGNGAYQATVYENVTGKKYATVLTASFSVLLQDEFAPFLRPNQYVNFHGDSAVVALGLELTRGLEEPLEKVAAVYDYVVETLRYDYDKAASVQSGYLPDPDQILEAGKGICFDYAAVMTAMLRSQQIPCKLVVGYAGSTYHAWISVWTEESGWIDGVIFFDGQDWKRMDPTFASTSEGSAEILAFIQNGKYTEKYLY